MQAIIIALPPLFDRCGLHLPVSTRRPSTPSCRPSTSSVVPPLLMVLRALVLVLNFARSKCLCGGEQALSVMMEGALQKRERGTERLSESWLQSQEF